MLRLTPQKDSRWVEIARFGVRIKLRPLTTAVMSAARAEAAKRLALLWQEHRDKAEAGFAGEDTGPSMDNVNWRDGIVRQYFAAALLRYAGEAWEGVGDEDGEPLPLNSVAAEKFAEHDDAASAFLEAAMAPLDALAAEGNGSALSSPGAGEEDASIAPDAEMVAARRAPLN